MPRHLLASTVASLVAEHAAGQFGGGGFGGGGYTPPAPICPAFACATGEKAVARVEHQVWSYGCKDSGLNVFSAGAFDPSDPFGGMKNNAKSVDKCCVERDICKQTCGMTSKACHDAFQKCSQKICKGDQNCQLQAMMSEIMSEPYDREESGSEDYKYDPEESKCRGYKKGQAEACTCVPEDSFRSATEDKLKNFYGKYNPEKLDAIGEIKDVDEVWKKWAGKEPEMFLALTTKYKAKAVDIRKKPKPPPYKPPPKKEDEASDTTSDDSRSADASEEDGAAGDSPGASAPTPPPTVSLDADDEAFESKLKTLQEKKKAAAAEEAYDLADEAKEQAAELKTQELERLQARKAQAIDSEDYVEAKRVKQRLARLEEL